MMELKTPWKYCVIGNIKKSHIDENGILRHGTPAYVGGAKVYLEGKRWDPTQDSIGVIGLSRGRRYYCDYVPVHLIENVRCLRVYRPKVLQMMNYCEYKDNWWGNTKEDREEVESFVRRWHNGSV